MIVGNVRVGNQRTLRFRARRTLIRLANLIAPLPPIRWQHIVYARNVDGRARTPVATVTLTQSVDGDTDLTTDTHLPDLSVEAGIG